MYASYTFVVDGKAWCVACDVHMAASDVEQHQATLEHKQRAEERKEKEKEKTKEKEKKKKEKKKEERRRNTKRKRTTRRAPRICASGDAPQTLLAAQCAAAGHDWGSAPVNFTFHNESGVVSLQPYTTLPAEEFNRVEHEPQQNQEQQELHELLEQAEGWWSSVDEASSVMGLTPGVSLAPPEELPLATQALSGEEEAEAEAKAEEVEERENAMKHDVEALEQLLALTSIQEPKKKERNMAVLVRLSFWVACWLSGDTGAHVPANLLLADLGVPERLHFPAQSNPDLSARYDAYHAVKVWLILKRSDFSATVYSLHIHLLAATNLWDPNGRKAHDLLDDFVREAPERVSFRPNFFEMWRVAMLGLGQAGQQDAVLSALKVLLETEAEWSDQQNS